jgi:hypothetical protein
MLICVDLGKEKIVVSKFLAEGLCYRFHSNRARPILLIYGSTTKYVFEAGFVISHCKIDIVTTLE